MTDRLHTGPDEEWSVELKRRDRFRYQLDVLQVHPATLADSHAGYRCDDCSHCQPGGLGHVCTRKGEPRHTLASWPGCQLIDLVDGGQVRTAADVPAMLERIRAAS